MESEDKKLLEETFELAKENNKLIHRIRGVQKRQALWSVLKILVIIGVALGAFYYLEPYMNKVVDVFNSISGIKQNVDTSSLGEMLKNVKP